MWGSLHDFQPISFPFVSSFRSREKKTEKEAQFDVRANVFRTQFQWWGGREISERFSQAWANRTLECENIVRSAHRTDYSFSQPILGPRKNNRARRNFKNWSCCNVDSFPIKSISLPESCGEERTKMWWWWEEGVNGRSENLEKWFRETWVQRNCPWITSPNFSTTTRLW